MQRFFDIVLSAAAIVLLSPVLVLVMIALRVSGEGEVFYGQTRIGRNGRKFRILKFATMVKDSENRGAGTVTVKNDPRVLPLGRLLRKTKMNELPQLYNVLKGDMSVIGPRPQDERSFYAFPAQSQKAIVQVRPGLSGIGSIVFRDEEDRMDKAQNPWKIYEDEIAPYKGALEEWYVANRNLSVYFKAIFVTLWVVAFPASGIITRVFPGLPNPPKRSMDSNVPSLAHPRTAESELTTEEPPVS